MSKNIHLIFPFLGGTEVWTKGIVCARKVLFNLIHVPSHFPLVNLSHRVSLFLSRLAWDYSTSPAASHILENTGLCHHSRLNFSILLGSTGVWSQRLSFVRKLFYHMCYKLVPNFSILNKAYKYLLLWASCPNKYNIWWKDLHSGLEDTLFLLSLLQ
jgi:hypothetical protein